MKASILIVDDDKDICTYMKSLLEGSGYGVDTLPDATEVMGHLREHDYHVIIVDLMMPKLGGLDLIRDIRRVDSDVAIMVSTGYPSVETAVEAMKLNVSDYIRKPFEIDEFRQQLTEVLKRKGVLLNPEEALHRTIGHSIRTKRKEQALTLKQLARRTGLSVSLLSQIERAESSASVGSLYKIASGLKLRLTELFGDF